MHTTVRCAFLIAFAVSLDAQITTTFKGITDRPSEITIRNNSAIAVSAFAVKMNPKPQSVGNGRSPFGFYFDSVTDSSVAPMASHEERVVEVPIRFNRGQKQEELFEEPIISAAIFMDGSSSGDAVLIERLLLRRTNTLLAVETTLDILREAAGRNVPRRQLVLQFSQMADALRRWYVPAEQQVGGRIYQTIVGKLMNLPAEPLGSPFPPSAFVEKESVELHRQRTALLEAQPRLAEAAFVSAR